MVGHGGSSAGSYLADPTSPILSHCASIIVTSTLRVKSVKVAAKYLHVLTFCKSKRISFFSDMILCHFMQKDPHRYYYIFNIICP